MLPSPPESAGDDPNAAQITVQQSKLSVQSDPSPQLMEVMQMENKESVPSATHPPVLIKAADDDKGDDGECGCFSRFFTSYSIHLGCFYGFTR